MKTRYYIDTFTPNDFDAVVRFLYAKNIPTGDRSKLKLMVSAELTEGELQELLAIESTLEEYISLGTTSIG